MKFIILLLLLLLLTRITFGQTGSLKGKVVDEKGLPVAFATLRISNTAKGTRSDTSGNFLLAGLSAGTWKIQASAVGYTTQTLTIQITEGAKSRCTIALKNTGNEALEEVVVTGTMREVSRIDSPVPVEMYTPAYFRKNPTPSLFDAVAMINGVQPQLNCNICNTGDIHINGMEGAYTMVLIDGMPIVSALSTVYGLSGIPNSMVERLEVVKGPASSLYGSEAMGGIINVITKDSERAPLISVDLMGTSWGERSTDGAIKFQIGKASSLIGINHYGFRNRVDNNGDQFTDMALQNRISLFNKWQLKRQGNRAASLAARYVYEDRWGGEINWNTAYRGSDEVYGESIYTKRAEIIGLYQLPTSEPISVQFSYNRHHQNSFYGVTPYLATQQVAFLQTYWERALTEAHQLLLGVSIRYTVYDDNTPATASEDGEKNKPSKTPLPGWFVQDEWKINPQHTLLLGYRYDYDQYHGSVHSPRLAYKFSADSMQTFRASLGTGFRVVNLFTEDHAALTGARQVIIAETLNPERSYNMNINYVRKIPIQNLLAGLDITAFYSYFTNKIVGDFDTDPNQIIYKNLRGHALSRGIAINADLYFPFPLNIRTGMTFTDVFQVENKTEGASEQIRQLQSPKWSGTFTGSYQLAGDYAIDLTAQWNSPMRLPVQVDDYRPAYSPWFCIANIQITKTFQKGLAIYGGLKNLFNFIPKYPLMRPFDPFDKQINDPINNPYGYTFDTEYNYASLQGIRGFLGIRYQLVKK